jgi:hypothetical protein
VATKQQNNYNVIFMHVHTKFMKVITATVGRKASDGDGGVGLHVFQVVGLETRIVKVTTQLDDADGKALMNVSVQPFRRWSSTLDGLESRHCLEIFIVEEPHVVDALTLLGDDALARDRVRSWTVAKSDVEGCLSLRDPQHVRPTMALKDASCPTLMLMDALEADGFVGVSRRVTHTAELGLKQMDSRTAYAKKDYFRCVLAAKEIVVARPEGFRSGCANGFYKVLLRSPTDAVDGQDAAAYKRLLRSFGASNPVWASLERAGVRKAVPVLADGGGHADVAGDDDSDTSVAPDPVGCVASVASSSSSSSTSSSTSSSESDGDGAMAVDVVAGDDDADEAPYPDQIMGQRVNIESKPGTGDTVLRGLRVKCNNPEHDGCRVYRSLQVDVARFGLHAPVYFVGAWLLNSHMPAVAHNKWKPPRALVQLYKDTYG